MTGNHRDGSRGPHRIVGWVVVRGSLSRGGSGLDPESYFVLVLGQLSKGISILVNKLKEAFVYI